MEPPLIAGNWKMHKTAREAQEFVQDLVARFDTAPTCDTWIFPPFTAIAATVDAVGPGWLQIGAQNVSAHESGAHTGEISATMLKDVGASGVLVGHSERRHVYGETNAAVAGKLQAALANGLDAVLCVGETLDQRDSGLAMDTVRNQLASALDSVDNGTRLTIAYEPVWAIGTGRTATPEQAQEMHQYIRGELDRLLAGATGVRILYGGSVKPGNAAELMTQADVDGVLVGGASLEPGSFSEIIRNGTDVVA